MITVTREGNTWIARFPFSHATKDVVKEAGFRFDGQRKLWYTTDPIIAARLDPDAAVQANQAIEASRATDAAVNLPAPFGLAYLPYQRAGIAYALGREATLIGDEMGLGKTIQAIGVLNASPDARSVLVVCPASLKLNWQREMRKWLVRPLSVEIANGSFPKADVVIINYDILAKHRAAIDLRAWDVLIADECHYAKNPKAQRTVALLGKRDRHNPAKATAGIAAKRRLFLTGTPIVNRPIELFPLVEALDPQGLGKSFFAYAKRYTNAEHNGYGWDFTGAANLGELQQRLRAKFMVRRLKSEVLTELPPKRRQVIVLDPPASAKAAIAAEQAVYAAHRAAKLAAEKAADEAQARGDKDGFAAAIKALGRANAIAFEEMSRVRHETAVAKIPQVIEHVAEVLEAEAKVAVFCHHLDVAGAVQEAFPGAVRVTGKETLEARQAAVDAFERDAGVRVLVGTYPGAAGVGWTLVAAQTAVFAELDWVPGNVSQAEDRLHRIGQTQNVLIQHLVFDGSVDLEMATTLIDKQAVIDAALDTRTAPVAAPAAPAPAPQPPPAAAEWAGRWGDEHPDMEGLRRDLLRDPRVTIGKGVLRDYAVERGLDPATVQRDYAAERYGIPYDDKCPF